MAASRVAERMLWTSSTQVATFLRLVSEHDDAEAKRIGQLIAKGREAKGWNQQDLAHELGVSVSTVSRWERGLHEQFLRNRAKVAKALDLAPALLRPVDPELETQLDRIEGKLTQLVEDQEAFRVEVARNALEVTKRLDAMRPPATPPRRRRQP